MTDKLGSGQGPQHNFLNTGRPYLSGAAVPAGAEIKFVFPRASRYFEVTNTTANGNDLRVYLASSGSGPVIGSRHYKTLVPSASFGSYAPIQNLFVATTGGTAADCEVYAELVDHLSGSSFDLTGSGITE